MHCSQKLLWTTKTAGAAVDPVPNPHASDSSAPAGGGRITEKIVVIQGIQTQFVATAVGETILESIQRIDDVSLGEIDAVGSAVVEKVSHGSRLAERELVSIDDGSAVQCDSPISAYHPGSLISEG
jgi:hypothetical protein